MHDYNKFYFYNKNQYSIVYIKYKIDFNYAFKFIVKSLTMTKQICYNHKFSPKSRKLMFFKRYVEKFHECNSKYHDLLCDAFWVTEYDNLELNEIHRSMAIMMGRIMRNIHKRKTGRGLRIGGLYKCYPYTTLKRVYEKLETHEDVDMFMKEYGIYIKKIENYVYSGGYEEYNDWN